ncbi:MAG: serine/threonine protein kinase [Xanthomonadales bacterium]|nr:serine/threonine protein kinase [Xanthomonadales bacterium]
MDSDPAQRLAFVRLHCASDAELEARVMALLCDADAIDTEDAAGADALPDEPADPLVGQALGAFRVIERIGRGGMGVVYRGEREGADFSQEVALKLIRRGFDFDDIRMRFLRERRILARLDHPNLARFIDGGVAPDGRPWFALEFVRGEPISAWCDARRLGLRARVRLFLDVCAAVQHAHGQLVVHRDLKPGNILVDADGHVRLLDFGIARLLADEETAATTVLGGRSAYTPEYAAPEQFGGAPAGVATDVYALGVVLYELVTGVLPYELERHDAAATERTIRERPPQAPIQAITRGGQQRGAERLESRGRSLRAFRSDVRGDLSRILHKALAKEPAQRYGSVQAFADDLARWRAGAPVQVSGNAFGYRMRKFVGRNSAAVAISAALACLLVLTTAFAVQRAVREYEQRTRAESMLTFLRDIFRDNDPDITEGEALTAAQLLDNAALRLTDHFRGDTLLEARLAGELGAVYSGLTLFQKAAPLLERSLAAFREMGAVGTREYYAVTRHLGEAYNELYRYGDTLALVDDGLVHLDSLSGTERDGIESDLLSLRGTALYRLGRIDEAEAAHGQAIELGARSERSKHELAELYIELGYVLLDGGNAASAMDAFRSSEELLATPGTGSRLQMLVSRYAVAAAYQRMGESGEAVRRLVPLLAEFEQLVGIASPRTMITRSQLAQAFAADGRYPEALDVIEINLQAASREGAGTERDRMEIGLVKAKLATQALRLEVARPLVEKGGAYIAASMSDPSYSRSRLSWSVGEFWLQAGDCARAMPALEMALADAYASSRERSNHAAAEALDSIGRCQFTSGDASRARATLDEAVSMFTTVLGEHHRRTLRSRIHRAWIEAKLNGSSGGLAALRPALVEALGSEDKMQVWQLDLMIDEIGADVADLDHPRRVARARAALRELSGAPHPPLAGLSSFS